MEPDGEIYNQTPGQTLANQSKRKRSEYMNKGGQDHYGEIYRETRTKLVDSHEL